MLVQTQTQSLLNVQNISAGNNPSGDRVRAVDHTDDGSRMLTVYGGLIKVWNSLDSGWVESFSITAPESLEDTRFNNNGSSILALANASFSAYVFEDNGSGVYFLTQTIEFDTKPLSLGWASKSNFTVFGTEDGTIKIYSKSNGNWTPYQTIEKAHNSPVIGIACRNSRILSLDINCSV